MIKIDIYSGFLGAGKTTLIKKLIKEAYQGQKVVLIENEFGEIGIDGGFLSDAGIEIKEINSGCICCSLTGDFREALKQLAEKFEPDRIIIEPSGVAKLSELAAAVISTDGGEFKLNGLTTVVDAGKCGMYMKNFGEFFDDQISFAHTVILSRTQKLSQEKLIETEALLRAKNPKAAFVTAAWDALDGKEILAAIDGCDALSEEIENIIREHEAECDDPECSCHHHEHAHHEHHHEHGCEHDHHEHHHEHDCEHDHHEHHHEHDCEHDYHEHHHGHGHDADELFMSMGLETARRYSESEISAMLKSLEDSEKCGLVLRAKGIVECADGAWIHFDYTPGEADIRKGGAALTGMLCVIGSELKEPEIKEIFKL